MQDILRRIGWGETIEHYETVRLRKDGSPVEVSLSISPIKTPSGAIIGVSKIARDITESKRDRAGAAPADRGASPHLRDFAGSDPGDGSQGSSGSDEPELPKPYWAIAPEEMIGRSASDFIHPDDLEISPQGNARGAARTARADFRYALHPQGRARS